jgi:hypothetical protein
LNVLVDENPDYFGYSILSFLHKVDDPSQVGIFIAFLHGPNANVNYICRALIEIIHHFPDPTNLTSKYSYFYDPTFFVVNLLIFVHR